MDERPSQGGFPADADLLASLATLARELRLPLPSMEARVQILRQEPAAPLVEEAVGVLDRQARHLLGIVDYPEGILPRRPPAVLAAEVRSRLGHEVRLARDGPGGVEAARSFRPEVVLCDIGMQGMDGYEVARLRRREGDLSGLVLVALAGWGHQDVDRQSREAGFDHHLVKPVDHQELLRLLAR